MALSVEMEASAHQTLLLRSFFRQFSPGRVPELLYKVARGEVPVAALADEALSGPRGVADAWRTAKDEARRAELGAEPYENSEVRSWINDALGPDTHQPWVLIGGPPCQAYSLIGRASNRRNVNYRPEDDRRHHLYLEYVKIIADRWPSVFVMENVKGILSSKLQGQYIFERILRDLRDPAGVIPPSQRRRTTAAYGYSIYSIVKTADGSLFGTPDPADFLVKCEEYGIPQERHRVILLGIRHDVSARPGVLRARPRLSIDEIIGGLPILRSGLSRSKAAGVYTYLDDSADGWIRSINTGVNGSAHQSWLGRLARDGESRLHSLIVNSARLLQTPQHGRGGAFIRAAPDLPRSHPLYDWYVDDRLGGVCNHESRLHLDTDLIRYLYAACYAKVYGSSPKLRDFPEELLPDHENAGEGIFDDRFRVQVAGRAATTITSHIAKDGHYYIHYDPLQCRALTVREAARLQTFPDNYLFCGPRTAQYTQVGNAVPPLLALQIAELVHDVLRRAELA